MNWPAKGEPHGLLKMYPGTSLGIQWLGLHVSIAAGTGSVLGRGTKILYAVRWEMYPFCPALLQFLCTVQFSSVAQLCPTVCNPMNCSTPGLPVHHQLPEFTQTHVHRVSDAI